MPAAEINNLMLEDAGHNRPHVDIRNKILFDHTGWFPCSFKLFFQICFDEGDKVIIVNKHFLARS